MSTTKAFKTVLLGCGRIGAQNDLREREIEVLTHAHAIHRHSAFVPWGCFDLDTEQSRKTQEFWSFHKCYTSQAEALSDLEAQVYVIATPTPFHAEALKVLASRPEVLVICEKPVVSQLAELDLLKAFLAPGGPRLIVNHTRRFDPAHAELREVMASRKLGELKSFRFVFSKGLVHNGIHAMDLLSFLSSRPSQVRPLVMEKSQGDLYGRFEVTLEKGVRGELEVIADLVYGLFEGDLLFQSGRVLIHNIGYDIEIFQTQDWKEYPGAQKLALVKRIQPSLDRAMYALYDFLANLKSRDALIPLLEGSLEQTRLLLNLKETHK